MPDQPFNLEDIDDTSLQDLEYKDLRSAPGEMAGDKTSRLAHAAVPIIIIAMVAIFLIVIGSAIYKRLHSISDRYNSAVNQSRLFTPTQAPGYSEKWRYDV